jgi:hypothetical protein
MIAMSKKTFIATIIITAFLISLVAGMLVVDMAEANPSPHSVSGTSEVMISILSPENKTYDANDVAVTIFAGAGPGVWYVGHSLDGGPYKEIAPGHPLSHTLTETVLLNRLTNASHSIEVKATAMANDEDGVVIACSKVYFTVTKTLEISPSPTPTATPTSTPTLPTPSPSPSPTPSSSTVMPIVSPSESPTRQPTTEPSQTPDRPQVKDFAPIIIPGSMILLAIMVVGLLVYFRKRKGKL